MSNLIVLRDAVVNKVKDDSKRLTPDDFDRNLREAIRRYSKHRPDVSVSDITGDGTSDYSLPAAWVDGFSGVQSIEYPIGNNPEDFLDSDEYKIYQTPTAKKLRLVGVTPAATESFRLVYTIPRTDTTVPEQDEDSLADLAASLCLDELANLFAQTSDPTIGADSVNYRTKSYEFAQRAKRYMQLYKEHIGIKDNDVTTPASAVIDLDEKYPGGMERLTHPRRERRKR